MSQDLHGNLKGLKPSERKAIERLYARRIDKEEIISLDLAREICELAEALRRRIGLLVDREGRIRFVVVGTKEIIYLPDIGRQRGGGRLRNLRFIFTDLSSKSEDPVIPYDVYGDLEKLKFDLVCGLKPGRNRIAATYAHLSSEPPVVTATVRDIATAEIDFQGLIESVEGELEANGPALLQNGAVLVGVYESKADDPEASIAELKELSRTAGLKVLDTITQRRKLDPKTFIGTGKLQELVLRCIRLGAEMLVFDAELKPGQWRAITNATELKVIDRSMLILDIFGQRAQSSDGRLQVELAQLKYNLPKLVEKDAGLSRLSGGIGGRGPGETKLEIGRRRIRDRITDLEKRLEKIRSERADRRDRRKRNAVHLVSIVGYTNAGKSTLFNALTGSTVLSEDKLFATLDTTQRRVFVPGSDPAGPDSNKWVVFSDTVGFIRELPKELEAAFHATLEELFDASLLLHVVDASDPQVFEKYAAVESTLARLSLTKTPELVVANKADAATEPVLHRLRDEYGAVVTSALRKTGLEELRGAVYSALGLEPSGAADGQGVSPV